MIPISNVVFGIRIFYNKAGAKMRILQCGTKQDAAETVALMLVERMQSHPASVIGLATGLTMVPLYETWARLDRERSIDHGRGFFFFLDEYLGVSPDHPLSFRQYALNHFIKPLGLREDQFVLPNEHQDYDQLIREAGGIDLQLLGIGKNGHIGFNEPGSFKESRTRKVRLSEETRITNKIPFEEAVSMGISTILEAKEIVLLATGDSKADAIKYVLNHHDDPNCPATYLKSHPSLTLVLDAEAASKINLKI